MGVNLNGSRLYLNRPGEELQSPAKVGGGIVQTPSKMYVNLDGSRLYLNRPGEKLQSPANVGEGIG